MLGILLIDKPSGMTSHDVVDGVRRRLGIRRVGHAGTLDPMATGILVVAVGPATRFLQYLPLEPKTYEGEAVLGVETDTQDAEGKIVAECPIAPDWRVRRAAAMASMVGEIDQIPPSYSAVKRGGKPLYAYARAGESVEVEARRVYVHQFEATGDGERFGFRVVCSGGTYVRTLVHDLGRAIGCGAHLGSLRRTAVGRFCVADAVPIDAVGPEALISLAEALPPMPILTLGEAQTADVREGRAIEAYAPARLVALAEPGGEVFSVARVDGKWLRPECVIPREAMFGSA
jgi:tRNA pseudouridine55 synthase